MSPSHSEAHSWTFSILVSLSLALIVFVYGRGWLRLRRSLPLVLSVWRLVAFVSGAVWLWVAVDSPLAQLDHQFLTIHMVQHLLLMTVAAPLMLLGAPAVTLLHGIPHAVVAGVLRPLSKFVLLHRLGRFLTHPVFSWLAATGVVMTAHIPALFELGMQSRRWHEAQLAGFFSAGLLFWWPVIQPWPSVQRWPRWFVPLYLFLAAIPCDALSAFLTFCDLVVYPHYLTVHRPLPITPLADQQSAGALMWVWVTVAYLLPAAIVTMDMLSPRRRTSNVELPK